MNVRLDSLTALVCGSSDGIGKAIAIDFAKAGANVILLAKSEDKLKSVLKSLHKTEKQKHDYISVDMNKTGELISKVRNLINEFSSIDILVNNTGGPPPGPIHKAKLNELEKAFNQHIKSAHALTQLLIQEMIEKKFGRIINIISVGMKEPIENLGISNTIRGAMGSWAKTLSKEIAPFGITVNNILPGYTATQRLIDLFENNAKKLGLSFDEYSKSILSKIPAKRFANPEEIAYLATFLASEYSSYINGTSIPVDGAYLSSI